MLRREWHNPRLAGRVAELDGVRGLAILLVVVYHYFVLNLVAEAGSWQAWLVRGLGLAWSGVDLFFVLSGFLIAGILLDARNSERYFSTFYMRRTLRIFPLYFIWFMLLVAGLAMTNPGSSEAQRALFNFGVPVWTYVLFLQNWFMSAGATQGALWISVTWSLAVEEQFYALLPALVRTVDQRSLVRTGLLALVIAPFFRAGLALSGNTYFGPYMLLPSRADALSIGVVLAVVCRNLRSWRWLEDNRRVLKIGLCVLAVGMAGLTIWNGQVFTFGLTWIALFYGCLLALVLTGQRSVGGWIFRNPILTGLGTVAYGIYLFHQGVNGLLHLALFQRVPRLDGGAPLGATLLAIVVTGLLAAGSWRWIEKPFIAYSHRAWKY